MHLEKFLIMGDGEMSSDRTGQPPGTSFDNFWGAGCLKMRRWDSYGLDAPYQFASYSTCIDDGENYYFSDGPDDDVEPQ